MGMVKEFKDFAVKGINSLKRHLNPRHRKDCARKYLIC